MGKQLDASIAAFDALSARFAEPRHRDAWAEAKTLLDAFRAVQDRVEAAAHTPKRFPRQSCWRMRRCHRGGSASS